MNKQCHIRLSACCEKKRTVGARLGQGVFQLVRVEGAEPCLRCMLEEDPIAQKHLTKLKRYRGQYDEWGNRLSRTLLNTRHLLEPGGDDSEPRRRRSRGRKGRKEEEEEELEQEDIEYRLDAFGEEDVRNKSIRAEDFNFTPPDKLTLSPPRHRSTHRSLSPSYQEPQKQRLNYKERFEQEHTYAAIRGGGRHVREQPQRLEVPSSPPAASPQETEADYESDFELDKEAGDQKARESEPKVKAGVEFYRGKEKPEDEYYENDSFIIDDDGGNDRDGDLTGSSARSEIESPYSTDKKDSKVSI